MTRPGIADAEDLLRLLVGRYDAGAQLPRLIRRLIMETGHGVVRLGFRAGAGVRLGGWDGTAAATESTPHIPAGMSLWELSVSDDPKQKADEDYEKRTKAPSGSEPQDCAYVAVTLRRYPAKEEWESDRLSDGRWREVRFYDVDNIETWLETAPVTRAWISELIGLHPHGLRAAESWWDGWGNATNPVMPAELILAGREEQAAELKSRLGQEPHVISISGTSREDIQAFVTAVVSSASEEDAGDLLSRTAIVDQVGAWRLLQDHKRPLVLLPMGEAAAEVTSGSPHYVVVPVVGPSDADIELPAIDPAKAEATLKAAGLEDRRAEEGARLASFSLLALRRRLAVKPELLRPEWAIPPVTARVRRLLVASQWNEANEADRDVVESIVEEEYMRLREALLDLAGREDPLVGSVGTSWSLVSAYDAWLLLRQTIQPQDLGRLRGVLDSVFLAVNPVLELPREDRWRASVLGKAPAHSADLRHGLATTLALLGALGNRVEAGHGATGEDWAGFYVRDVLAKANEDESGLLWASLGDVLPLIAEAAPGSFLDGVRDGLNGDSPLLAKMFQDRKGGDVMFSDSPHSNLLWALETAAWSPDHFGQAIDLLGRLAEVDPGGRLANRPAESLDAILCPWHPQNSVSVASRLAAIDGLRERHAEVASRLMMRMLPERYAVSMPTSEPKFRDWKPTKIVVTRQEYANFVEEIVRRLLEDVGTSHEQWLRLIRRSSDIPPAARERLRSQLGELLKDDSLSANQKTLLWAGLREITMHHRRFADADWALPSEEVDELEDLASRLLPESPEVRHAWLFDEQMPEIPEKSGAEGFAEYERALAEMRSVAVQEIEQASGWQGIHEFARDRKFPPGVGVALADGIPGKYENEILGLLASSDERDVELAHAYFVRRYAAAGWGALDPYLNQNLEARQKARLLLASFAFPEAWQRAEQLGDEVKAAFWQHFHPYGLGEDFAHATYAAECLLKYGRTAAALQLLTLYWRKDETGTFAKLIATGLERFLESGDDDPDARLLDRHDFSMLFEYLQSSNLDWQRLAQLEWAYAAVLDFEHRLQTLERLMSTEPAVFVDMMTKLFRPKADQGKEHAPASEEQERVATNAYRVLSHWTRVPGTADDGSINPDDLRQWVTGARKLLAEADRTDIGDVYIGHALAHADPDADAVWPPKPIRDLLEELQNDKIEEGLVVQTLNNRGVTTRAPTEGGAQERELAAKYREQARRVADQWPRSARVLNRLADNYDRDARHQDEEAERLKKGFER